jgi:hypothetical protein
MFPDQLATFVLRYPDGWEESWAVRPDATRESMLTLAMQLLELAGCDVTYHVNIPDGAVPLLSTQLEGLIDKLRHSGIAPSDEVEKQKADDIDLAPASFDLVLDEATGEIAQVDVAEVTAPPAPAPPKKPPPRRDRPNPVDEPLPPAA